jgi:hypothetical protein
VFQDWLYPSSLVIGDLRRSGPSEIKAEGISGFHDLRCSWIDRHLRSIDPEKVISTRLEVVDRDARRHDRFPSTL